MNEQELCKKRLEDLSKQADRRDIVVFSDFLNLNELNIYHQIKSQLYTRTETFGGMELSERQMVAFLPDALYYDWEYPITCLKIVPAYPKFAEELTHRDVLGSLMNLGVDRSKVGDIIMGEKACYLFCEEGIAPYFMDNFEKVKHTLIKVEPADASEVVAMQHFEEKSGIITSNRIDSVIACVCQLSRSKASELIRAEKVFVNGKAILSNTYCCKEREIISVRGMGRFVYEGVSGETQKGRLRIQYKLYQ